MTERYCCSDCNHILDEVKDAEYCSNCGASWEDESEIRCPKCNDLLDAMHKLTHCARCGQLLVPRALKENPPFISKPSVALVISIICAIALGGLVITFLELSGNGAGKHSSGNGGAICGSAIAAGIFAACVSIYKFLIAMGYDVMEDKE